MRSEKRRIIRRVARRDVGNSTRDVWFARPGEARALWRRTIEPSQSIRSSGRTVLDRADDCSEDGACNAATGRLADDGADIRRRCGIGQQRNQRTEKLAAGAAADRARDGISNCAEIDVLGGTSSYVSSDGASDDLNNEVDKHARHDANLPRSGVQFQHCRRRRTIAARPNLRWLSHEGHAALAKEMEKLSNAARGEVGALSVGSGAPRR